MRREFSPIIISIVTLLLLAGLAFAGFQGLKRLPSNYLSMLPKTVQNWVVPEPESAFLPPAPVALETEALLAIAEPTPTPVPTPTLIAPEVVVLNEEAIEPTTPVEAESSEQVIDAFASAEVPTEEADGSDSAETQAAALPDIPKFHRISDVTYHKQDWNNCGPATLAMGLSMLGLEVSQYDTADYLKPSYEDRNVTPQQMADYVDQFTEYKSLNRVNGNIDTLKRLVANYFPVIIEVGDRAPSEVSWIDSEPGVAYRDWWGHYLLAAGYDDDLQEIWVYDSLIWDIATEENTSDGHSYSYEDLLTFWPQFNGSYVILYPPEREQEVADILGVDFDLVTMWERTLERNERALQNQPDNAFLWFNMGTAYNSLGRHEEAANAFDKARVIGLPWRMLWYQFGPYEAYFNTGQYQQIIVLADATLAARPYFEESFFWRGMAKQALGDTASARADFDAAVQFNRNFAPAVDALNSLDS